MRARPAALAAVAAFALAPAANAATFDVTDGGDAGPDTLRQALLDADATPEADTITFSVATVDVASTLESNGEVDITGPVELGWSGNAGPLLRFAAGAAGSSITDVDVLGGSTAGIELADGGISITRTRVSDSAGHGIDLDGHTALISDSPIFGNDGEPIANSPVEAPQGLRVGPRQADGALPVTGSTAAGGVLELFRGNPAGTSPIARIAGPGVPAGSFSHVLAAEPPPASAVSGTITSNRATSGFATTRVPFDVVSPDLAGAVAISTSEVTVQLSEPVRADSVQIEDFSLQMAGSARPISGLRIEPGGAQITLASPVPWGHGEAGALQLGPPGSLLDAGGNASLAATGVRVAAAPGDLIPPIGSSLSIRPRSFCLTRSRTCRRTGTTVRFVASEAGRAHLVLMRGNRRIGEDVALSEVGRNRIRFNGRLGNRKLRPGRYRMLVYLEDAVGNVTIEPPIQLFGIRSSRRP